MTDDKSTRKTPPESEDDWAYVWDGLRKAHSGWFIVKVLIAVFGNWRVIMIGSSFALIVIGPELAREIIEVLK